jgi:hypothetical protein
LKQKQKAVEQHGPELTLQHKLDMSADDLKHCSARFRSLPCTVVASAGGTLEVLRLKCDFPAPSEAAWPQHHKQ